MAVFLTPLVVTYAYIFFSARSSKPRSLPSTHTECSPTPCDKSQSHSFGGILMPDYYPCLTARLVSCYALFK
nr:hypothetical protein [uncultured bacterium]